MEAVVAADGVHKTYGDTVALAGVSLEVEAGEVFGLIGPNGAGKTTLVRALTGTVDPDEGSVRLLGTQPARADEDRLGVLPQEFSPPDRLTARELLTYYAGLYATARDPEAVLADVGLGNDGDTWYEHLSGGQRRRVCVGTALVNDPDVLFLDEPTTGIDPAGRRTVWGLIEALASGGTTVVLTTHDMAEAERLADRVGLLARGELIAVGTPAALVDAHGGESRLTVELDATGDPADVSTATALKRLGFDVAPGSDRLVIDGVEPREIGTVAASLNDADIEYTELSWAEPGLEDVYLELAEGVEIDGTGGRVDGMQTNEHWAEANGADSGWVEPGVSSAVVSDSSSATAADESSAITDDESSAITDDKSSATRADESNPTTAHNSSATTTDDPAAEAERTGGDR